VAVAVLAIGCSERETPMAPSEQGPGPYGLSWDDGAGDESTGSSSAAPLRTHPLPATADFVNGSFETGDYTGWTLFEGGFRVVPHFGAWGIAENGQTINRFEEVFDFFDGIMVEQRTFGLPHTYTTSDGDFLALQLVRGPQMHRMYQDLVLPDGAQTLSWTMEYTNHSLIFLDIDFNQNQEISVTVRDPVTDEILATLFVTEPGSPQSIPMTIFVRDISAFGGQTVRIGVDMNVIDFLFDAAFDNFVAHSSLDLDQDGTLDLPDDCPDDFGPADNQGCPRPEVPEGTEISTEPRVCDIEVDGRFGSPGCVEWADVTTVVVLGGESIVYQSLDPEGADLYLMYDFIGSQTPLEPGDEDGQARFFVGDDVFDVSFIQGAPPGERWRRRRRTRAQESAPVRQCLG